jgi:small subunit ribosomal protein S16
MVKIRLRRTGLKNQASYRIVVCDKEAPRDGRFLEIVGFYNPRTEPFTFDIKEDRIYHWLRQGAQPSESLAKLFKSVGLTERFEKVKAGESEEIVLEEAKNFYENRKINQQTRKD